ncbi:MAG: YkgJ family cysteine cluster protein [Planctomycetota bacterium]|nr:YkgJ family cysteine cluster protein [Planctomycetota bacterium]
MSEAPWYKDGLRFKCTQCGNCCTGAPGYVWVNKAEIEAMARLLDMDVASFEEKFVRKIGIRKSLVEYANFDCVFFDNKSRKCQVYAARPRQCRTWPFWDSNLRTPDAWERTCEVCPGSGTGPLIPLEQVQKQAAVIKI